ncbi:MAG: biopolymer transporter ExbD [Ramlibacter sp.]
MLPMFDTENDAEVMVDINTTPLVDVLLVLLVMLIITIPIQLHSVNIDMPGSNTPPPLVQPDVVQLDVTAAGIYLWNGAPLASRAELEERLQRAAAQPNQPEIHLRPNRTAKYDTVAAALAGAQRVGLTKIGLVGSEQFRP